MAWRDSRASRQRLLLFVSSITLGVAALMAISSFGVNLRQGLDYQAKTLLGADLVIRARQPFSDAAEAIVPRDRWRASSRDEFFLHGVASKDWRHALGPGARTRRRISVFWRDGDGAGECSWDFRQGPLALVEDGLMLQYNAAVGDEIRIGSYTYRIAGRLRKVPGENATAGLLGARVYIPKEYLNQTRLLQRGSSATYKISFRLPPRVNAEQLVKKLEPEFIRLRLDSETVEERKANLGRSLENAYDYLNLVAFIALLLGSIGVASSVHVYIKQKVNTLAVLRCLGAKSRSTFAIYLIQTSTLGLIGAISGVLLGLAVQYVLPRMMQDFIPVTIPFFISWASLAEAMVTGFGISLLFSLLPLLGLRRVSPLLAIRASYEEGTAARRDLWRWLIYALILIAWQLSLSRTRGAGFTGSGSRWGCWRGWECWPPSRGSFVFQPGRRNALSELHLAARYCQPVPAQQPNAGAHALDWSGHVPDDDALPHPRGAGSGSHAAGERPSTQHGALRHPDGPKRRSRQVSPVAERSDPPGGADRHDAFDIGAGKSRRGHS